MNSCKGNGAPFKNIYLRGTLQDDRLYVNASTSSPPTTYTQYITVPVTGSAYIEFDDIRVTAQYIQASTIRVSIYKSGYSSLPFYVGWQYTESYYETDVKVNDASLDLNTDEVAYLDTRGTSQNWSIYTYGKMASLYFEVSNSGGTIQKGNYIYEGSLLNYTPTVLTPLVSQAGSSGAIIGYIMPDGTIKLVHTGTSTTINISNLTQPLKVATSYIYQ